MNRSKNTSYHETQVENKLPYTRAELIVVIQKSWDEIDQSVIDATIISTIKTDMAKVIASVRTHTFISVYCCDNTNDTINQQKWEGVAGSWEFLHYDRCAYCLVEVWDFLSEVEPDLAIS